MKNIVKIFSLVCLLILSATSCEDFLNRPEEDHYNTDNFYQTDEQCFQAANILYNSPWYDVQRFFIKSGEVFSGNFYEWNSPYGTFTVNASDEYLGLCSQSLWSVNAYANSVIENIDQKSGSNVSEVTKRTVKGEALVWKAMAYFFLVRTFGEIPIVHNNSAEIAAGDYNSKYKVVVPKVYDYITMNLEKAIEWLPEENKAGRIDRYSAYGLLAKVYLTKAGVSGSLNQDDLRKAAENANKVIEHYNLWLEPNYSDIFRLQNNFTKESLISWRWKTDSGNKWTAQNTLQSDLSVAGFSDFGDNWGTGSGPTVDLQDAFGVSALNKDRSNDNRDTRRKATIMMYGDVYEYFWTDHPDGFPNGFDWTKHLIVNREGKDLPGTGANWVKHIVGNAYDHQAFSGEPMYNMSTSLATHLLRLADVYLIYAEAKVLLGEVDASALAAFNAVHQRALNKNIIEAPVTVLTWKDVWKERRLELAGEGDRWYDYVRWHYYAPTEAIAEIKAQKRDSYTGLKEFYTSDLPNPDSEKTYYTKEPTVPNVTNEKFYMPFPSADVDLNPNLLKPAQDIDISQFTY